LRTGILPPGSQGGDSDAVCAPATARALSAAGAKFLIRYVSRTTPNHSGDLSAGERKAILSAGLGVGYVQHCPLAGWVPSGPRGLAYGAAAVANLVSIGATPGICVWRDWEGVLPGSSATDAIADINSWNQQVSGGGFVPGIYVGVNEVLSGSDLYWRLTCSHYWKGASIVPTPAVRGWQMIQSLAPSPIPNYDWDRDVVMQDALGGSPVWDLP
jgi:hypothetical protein